MRKFLILLPFILLFNLAFSQEKYSISGYVKDAANGEEQIGATVYIKELQKGVATNLYGYYSITVPKGTYTLVVQYIGFQNFSKSIVLNKDMRVDVELKTDEGTQLNEIVVESKAPDENVKSLEMSTTKIDISIVKKAPALLGEVDVIKVIQLLPGVQTVGEGGSGFYVRGGSVDQNLILLDEATVYNASHLMGFFSVFNSDAVKDVKLYKGGIPAQYGGRLSSVLDIRMKDGNQKKFAATGGVGLISSRLTLEGPIIKDKMSYIVSGRRFYGDKFLVFASDTSLRKTKLYFYDLNGKVNWKINENNRVFVSAYNGRDNFNLGGLFDIGWGNSTTTARWSHIFSDKLFMNLTGIYSRFDYHLGSDIFDWDSYIQDYSGSVDFDYFLNPNNKIKFGAQSTYHEFSPRVITGEFQSTKFRIETPKMYGFEHAAYFSNEQNFTKRFSGVYGLRYSLFQNIGKATVMGYDNYVLNGDSAVYAKGEVFNTYGGFEPRLGLKYALTDVKSIKLSYNRTRQYLHLASNSLSSSPLDVWIPSNPNIKPQIADQVALGYFQNFKQNMYELSIEGYYKYMDNAIDFKDHAELIMSRYLDGELRFGVARSYGLEFMVRKNVGKLSGWVSYTWAKSERKIDQINSELYYPAKYDKRHNLSVVTSYEINKRWEAGAIFVYSTGAAITAPVGRYLFQGVYVPIYSERNGARMPPYHRMDLSATLKPKEKEGRKFGSEWVFSVYNAYGRKNPYNITFKESKTKPDSMVAEMVYLFSVVPAVTYNFKF